MLLQPALALASLDRDLSTARASGSSIASVGETVGNRWTIDALLSSSAGASVYAATDRRGRRAAIKVLSGVISEQRFAREIAHTDAASTVGSPALLGYGTTDDGVRYLVLELLTGKTLAQHSAARGGRFDLATALLLTERLLTIVRDLHRVGIIHRDIQPTNVFITGFGEVRLIDFSAASGAYESLRGDACGVPGFAAPEQVRGVEQPGDPRVDVFAVGALLFWMLGGSERPIARLSAGATCEFPIEHIAHLPYDVLDFLELSLAFEPHRRLASAAVMHAVLTGMRHALSGLERPADES